MIKSTVKAMGVVAALAAITLCTPAHARVNVGVGFEIIQADNYGSEVYEQYDGYGSSRRPPRRVYEEEYVDPGYYPPRRDRYEYDDYDSESANRCAWGQKIIRRAGYRDVEPKDCTGRNIHYKARREDRLYEIKLNSRGEIVRVREVGRLRPENRPMR